MFLHEAIEVVLRDAGLGLPAREIARLINQKGLYKRGDGKPLTGGQVSARVARYPQILRKQNGLVELVSSTPICNYQGPYTYRIEMEKNQKQWVIKNKAYCHSDDSFESCKEFKKPITQRKLLKIYIIQYGADLIYVGYSSQSIGARLNNGLKAPGTFKDYKGYKWKEYVNQILLHVFVFGDVLKEMKSEEAKAKISFVEAIEAEIAYRIRTETGKWPLYQNEIHFNNVDLENTSRIAAEIYNKLKNSTE